MPNQRIAEFAGYRLDYGERSLLTPQGAREQLSRRLFDTLALLVERAGQLVEKQELMRQVWGDVVVEENTLSRTISSLRQKLGETSGEGRVIATVSGVGYRFIQKVVISNTVQKRPDAPLTIAALPFDDFSAMGDQQHVAAGLVDELISAVAGLPGLRVTARTSSSQLRGVGARAAGQRLGVAYVLTGAVRKDAGKLRVSVQLIDTASEQQLWATQRDGSDQALFALQESVSRAVLEGIAIALRILGAAPRQQRAPDPAAYDLLLRARAAAQLSGGPAIMQTYALLKQALARDPDFATAWAVLSVYARSLILFGVSDPDIPRDIERAAERTLALEPDWWSAHLASSSRHHLHRDWLAMEQSLRRARELAPGMPSELRWMSASDPLMLGHATEAVEPLREVVDSDPLSLVSSAVYQLALHMSGSEAVAEIEYQRSLDLQGDRDMVEHLRIHRLWAQDRPIHEQLRRYLQHQSLMLPVLHELEPVHDQPGRAVPLLMDALSQAAYAAPAKQQVLGWWLAKYRADDEAMDVLWRSYVDAGHINTSWLWFPVLSHLRQRPRFDELLERVGLARYWQLSGTTADPPLSAESPL